MPRIAYLAAVAALLGVVSPSQAFHPCWHHSHTHTRGSSAGFAVAGGQVTPYTTFHATSVTPFTTFHATPFTTFNAVPFTTYNVGSGSGLAAAGSTVTLPNGQSFTANAQGRFVENTNIGGGSPEAIGDGNFLTVARLICRLLNSGASGSGTGFSASASASATSEVNDLRNEISELTKAVNLLVEAENARIADPAKKLKQVAPPKAKSPVGNPGVGGKAPPTPVCVASEPDRAGLLALERDALARQAAAAAVPAPAAAPAPAPTTRDRDLADLRALEREALARQTAAAAAAPTTPTTATVRR